jgi:hypothetical protein
MTRMLVDAVAMSATEACEADFTIGKSLESGEELVDIEHVPVKNDPRTWSLFRKVRSTKGFFNY